MVTFLPVPIPSKIVCVGRNYADHAKELDNALPAEPLLFLKPPSALIPHAAPIHLPAVSQQVEHEAELGVIVGKTLHQASEAEARAAILGITCVNDVTARDLQKRDGQWTRAKGFDTFCPVGPHMLLIDATCDLEAFEILGRVNGDLRQHGVVREMHFSIPRLLSYISGIMTLYPHDLVATGTPAGVGPLHAGDQVEVEIPGVGTLSNPVIHPPETPR